MLYFIFYVKKRKFHCRFKTKMRLDGLQLCVYTLFRNFGPLEEAVTLVWVT